MVSRPRIGTQQKKVIEILTAYPHSTIAEVASIIHKHPIIMRSKQYNSVCRSFHLLENAGLIERESRGAAKWHVKPKTQ